MRETNAPTVLPLAKLAIFFPSGGRNHRQFSAKVNSFIHAEKYFMAARLSSGALLDVQELVVPSLENSEKMKT